MEKRRRRKADWRSSIKAAVDFHPSCGDTEGEGEREREMDKMLPG